MKRHLLSPGPHYLLATAKELLENCRNIYSDIIESISETRDVLTHSQMPLLVCPWCCVKARNTTKRKDFPILHFLEELANLS